MKYSLDERTSGLQEGEDRTISLMDVPGEGVSVEASWDGPAGLAPVDADIASPLDTEEDTLIEASPTYTANVAIHKQVRV